MKIVMLMKETFYLIKKHKFYFLAPIFITLTLLAILVYTVTPNAMITFIYAGV